MVEMMTKSIRRQGTRTEMGQGMENGRDHVVGKEPSGHYPHIENHEIKVDDKGFERQNCFRHVRATIHNCL
jgi:hypothetical protein